MKTSSLVSVMLATLLTATSCGNRQKIEGAWYGIQYQAPLTLTFNQDQTLTLECEASASMSMSANYQINYEADPIEIDLRQTSSGMAGAGILRLNDDKSMDFCLTFGAPGMVQRPVSFEPNPLEMTTVSYHLYRDKAAVMEQLAYDVEAPAEAELAFERNRRLGNGINLNAVVDGNLHPGYQRDAPLADSEIKSIADAGFESIRLNVTWSKHAQKTAPYTIDPAFFAKVDHIVNECLKNNLAVSIDVHYYPYINCSEPEEGISFEENFVRLDCLWQQIAQHYKDYPNDMLFFDLLNEPNMELGADRWNQTAASLIKTIRQTNPDRTLLVLTPNLGQSWTLNLLQLPTDDWNLIVQFHYYMPHLFTHQGLAYARAEDSHNVGWEGTEAERALIAKDLDFCRKWSLAHHRPLNLGEYGANNAADVASRARYIGYVLDQARERGFSTHLWGYRECFQIRDEQTGEWIAEILEAMKLKNNEQ